MWCVHPEDSLEYIKICFSAFVYEFYTEQFSPIVYASNKDFSRFKVHLFLFKRQMSRWQQDVVLT